MPSHTRTSENGVSQSASNDPFIFETFVPQPPQIPRLNTPLSLYTSTTVMPDEEEDLLRPFIHIFRLDPFSTHDGVHGRPVPAALRARAPEGARPLMLEFQLDLPDESSLRLSPAESTEREDEPTKQEDETNPLRLLYLDGQATYFSGTAGSGSTDDTRSSPGPRLLRPHAEPRPERAQFEMTPWPSPPIFHPIPRSPGQAQVHPFSQVTRSPGEAFQPLTLTPAPEHPFEMRAPLQNFPTSLAYHAEARGHEDMPALNAHGYASTAPGSSLNMSDSETGVGYNYNTFGYETNGSSDAGYASDQPTERLSSRDYRNPYALPDSRSNARDTSLQLNRQHSFSQSHFPPTQAFQQPHSHFNTYGNDVPAQPPVTNFHESSANHFPERLGRDTYYGASDPLNKLDGFQPNFLSKPILAAPSPSPTPQRSLPFPDELSPIPQTSLLREASKSPSPSRSMSLSPTSSVESCGSGDLNWPRRLGTRQHRIDLSPYIPGRMRQHNGKPKEHWCTVCNKPFKRPSTLATHMNIHTGEKPYFCPVVSCGRRFSVSSNLTRHFKTHGFQGAIPRGPRAKSNRFSADNERRARNSMAAAASRAPLVERSNATEPWCPESLRGMRNANLLSSRAPFVVPENIVPARITLPPVRPWGNVGDENYEERDSFHQAEESDKVNPYHPSEWYLHPALPGPLPSYADREAYARERGGGMSDLVNGQPSLGGVFGHGGGNLSGSTRCGES